MPLLKPNIRPAERADQQFLLQISSTPSSSASALARPLSSGWSPASSSRTTMATCTWVVADDFCSRQAQLFTTSPKTSARSSIPLPESQYEAVQFGAWAPRSRHHGR